MPISGCHDLPLATFNLPSRNNLQNKPNSAATMSLPCSRFATAQPQRRWDAPPGKQHRHSGIFRVADLGPGTMPRGKYPESPAPAGSHALVSRTPTPGGMLHANLGLPRPPPRNFQPPLPQLPPGASGLQITLMLKSPFLDINIKLTINSKEKIDIFMIFLQIFPICWNANTTKYSRWLPVWACSPSPQKPECLAPATPININSWRLYNKLAGKTSAQTANIVNFMV